MNRYLLIDGNNIIHAASGTKKKLTVGSVEVQGIYNFLRTMRTLLSKYGQFTPLVLWDGASWRKMAFSDYKENREKDDTPAARKQKADRASAKAQIPAVKKAMTLLGVTQVKASNMEADDLAAILTDLYTKKGGKIILVSGDKDWLQLVSPNVTWYDPVGDRKVMNIADLEEKIGIKVADWKQFLEMKCLMGDLGDNIPGVGGVGEKGAQDFLAAYGSYANFSNMCMTGDVDVSKLHKKIRALAEDEDKRILFARNMSLMDLRTKIRPLPANMQVSREEASLERFTEFCERLVFKSMLTDVENWTSVFPGFKVPWEQAA